MLTPLGQSKIKINPARAQMKTINIITKTSSPLNTDLNAVCDVDSFFRGAKFKEFDILNPDYVTLIKALNHSSRNYSGGSKGRYDHVVIDDTDIVAGAGSAYNFKKDDFHYGESFDSAFQGINNFTFTKDFFNQWCSFLTLIDSPGDIIANIETGTLDELIWKIERANSKRVTLGLESISVMTPAEYVAKASAWIPTLRATFPKLIIGVAAGLIYKRIKKNQEFNDALKPLDFDEARLYLQMGDRITFTTDAVKNLEAIENYFGSLLPQDIADFKTQFPGKNIAAWQINIEDNRDDGTVQHVNKTSMGAYAIGRMYEFLIKNQDIISYGSWMSQSNLINISNQPDANYKALEVIGRCFSKDRSYEVCDLEIKNMPNVSGIALNDGINYCLFLNSKDSATVVVDKLKVNGTVINPSLDTKAVWGTDWKTVGSSYTTLSSDLLLNPRSVQTLIFSTT